MRGSEKLWTWDLFIRFEMIKELVDGRRKFSLVFKISFSLRQRELLTRSTDFRLRWRQNNVTKTKMEWWNERVEMEWKKNFMFTFDRFSHRRYLMCNFSDHFYYIFHSERPSMGSDSRMIQSTFGLYSHVDDSIEFR